MQLEHIGIAVEDIEQAISVYERLLHTKCYKTEIVSSQRVHTAFFQSGESKIELLGATEADSVIAKFIAQRGEGLHHIAFEVEDIHQEMERLQQEGFTLLSEAPREGADNKVVVFVHPKDNNGVLIELCQSKDSESLR